MEGLRVVAAGLQPVSDLVFPEADGGLDSDVGNEPTAYPRVDRLGVHLEAGFQVLRREQLGRLARRFSMRWMVRGLKRKVSCNAK